MEIQETAPRFAFFTEEKDREFLREAMREGEKARSGGDNPFGAILVDDEGNILLRQGNCERTQHDRTAHAEAVLARRASQTYEPEFLWNCTLYTGFEPCAMCTGAAYWANIGRIVYAVSEADLLEETGANEINPTFNLNCRAVLSHGQKEVVVRGPFLDLKAEAEATQAGFWE